MSKIFYCTLLIACVIVVGINVTSTSIMASQEKINKSQVPLPTGEDVVRLYFNLINEKRIPEAIGMMHSSMVPDDTSKQQWGVQFNSLASVSVIKIEPFHKKEWTRAKNVYKVVLKVKVKPEAANAPIPNYGWENGENVRWIHIQKDKKGLWKISQIATGP
ncbi:MAG: hypothetical protein NTV31_17290 [Bacteroidia bacterium]|nr:hypothetical protein [Bacteroidia bacterium]